MARTHIEQQEAALAQIRAYEFDQFIDIVGTTPLRVLEIGVGHGWLVQLLSSRGHSVVALDIPGSEWRAQWSPPTVAYDGVNIPLPNASVDVVLSSHVLMEVAKLTELHREIRRVLKPAGYCIHSLPTPSWRLWTTAISPAVGVKDALFSAPPKLGKRASHIPHFFRPAVARGLVAVSALRSGGHIDGTHRSFLGELMNFSQRRWLDRFARDGFTVEENHPMGIFYTGHPFLGTALPASFRVALAKIFGSGSRLYKVRPMR